MYKNHKITLWFIWLARIFVHWVNRRSNFSIMKWDYFFSRIVLLTLTHLFVKEWWVSISACELSRWAKARGCIEILPPKTAVTYCAPTCKMGAFFHTPLGLRGRAAAESGTKGEFGGALAELPLGPGRVRGGGSASRVCLVPPCQLRAGAEGVAALLF